MELYHNKMSVCSQKVRLVLYEKGLAATEHHLNLAAGESHTPEYLSLNPGGVVPTLIDREEVITESTIICEYLDDAYPVPSLKPRDALTRARMRHWTLQPDAGLHQWCSTISFAIAWRHDNRDAQMALWSPQKRAARMEAVEQGLNAPLVAPHLSNYLTMMRSMANSLGHNLWLAGPEFSLADTAIIPYICRLDDMALDWIWSENPALAPIRDWLDRCKARDSFVAISEYYDPDKLTTMKLHGQKERGALERIISDL